MNIVKLQETLRETVKQTASEIFGVNLEQVASEIPPKTELGDLAFPVAFELAKLIKQQTGEKQNPRAIAERLKSALEQNEAVERVEIAGPGYLNVFYNRAAFLSESLNAEPLPKSENAENIIATKSCVEHTSVNPNKAAHIGHVRNAVLGDTFVRILRVTGERVEIQYYIDNTGVQVADVVIGFVYLEKMDLSGIIALDKKLLSEGKTFDYYCWDLYAKVGAAYQQDEEFKAKRAEVLHLIEEGNNPMAELADYVVTRNVQSIVATMERIGIRYNLLPRESEILHLHFWKKAFEEMQKREVIKLETEGKNTGCWVMPLELHTGTDEHDADKILVRSNGTVTYTGKDIAYQMWKLGLLGLDFYYAPFHKYKDGKEVWVTTAEIPDKLNSVPEFGNADHVYNVIDTRQSYPQEVVRKGVSLIAPEKGESASVHLSYEMVVLSSSAAEVLGFQLSEEDKQKSFIEMSGRKGLGVKADDLITRLEENALIEVENREQKRLLENPEYELLTEEQKTIIAHQIAVGGLRYFLLKFTRNTIIVFDFKEALALEGETGVFCQYSAVRANSIFRKLEERGKNFSEIKSNISDSLEIAEVFASEAGNEIWSILVLANRLEETVANAANANEPAILAKYTFNLAKAFNLFYHHHKILIEKNPAKRAVLLAVADAARQSLTAALNTLGIEIPERM